MNFVDVIFFQAEIAPDKLALVAHGSIIPYGRLAQGILSAQQRLSAIGLTERQTVGVHVVHPIDNLVLICALHRMRVTYANITNALDAYLENVQFDAVLADNILPTVSSNNRRPSLYWSIPRGSATRSPSLSRNALAAGATRGPIGSVE